MKKHILTFIIALCTICIQAQENFGAFVGTNYSYFTDGFQKQINAEDSFGLQIGILYELNLNEKISFRPKLSYSQQGDRVKSESSNNVLAEIDTKLNYLNASLDFKFWNKIYIITGPQIGYLLSQKKESFNLDFIQKEIDFGLNFGGGFVIKKLFFELGFYQGLTTLLNVSKTFSSNVIEVKNSHFKFTVGYKF